MKVPSKDGAKELLVFCGEQETTDVSIELQQGILYKLKNGVLLILQYLPINTSDIIVAKAAEIHLFHGESIKAELVGNAPLTRVYAIGKEPLIRELKRIKQHTRFRWDEQRASMDPVSRIEV
ncbi:MAG: hypothetical protein J7K00_03050 [Candidatus Diapherotrites archaeon]|nr:hypothetical protein [Candidatus Diapherotrites archaeon]